MNRKQKIFFGINLALICSIFALNYVYQSNGFDFTLKCVCSIGFALIGAVNLLYAISEYKGDKSVLRYPVTIAAGLAFACAGDIVLGYDFVIGASLFAIGHICYFLSYCVLEKWKLRDTLIGGAIFLMAGAFLLFCPLLNFPNPVMQIVCFVYALIISLMLGKAVSNLVGRRTLLTTVIFIGSLLFFFSDLMLVFDWFMDLDTASLCMGTYYPAECLLAFSSFLMTWKGKE